MQHNPGFLALVDDAKTRVREIDVAAVLALRAAGTAFWLVDVREDREWELGHMPGAVHLGRGVLERDVETVIPDKHARIVLTCGGGYRSALAADNLQRMGYADVTSLAGGWRAWKDAGAPVEPG